MNTVPAKNSSAAQPETVALFVSDLHLNADLPKTTRAFFDFLQNQAMHAKSLYLLGDIFDAWAGDDDLNDPFHQPVIAALRRLSEHGVALFWIAGNRDFLVGEAFAAACGMHRLSEPHVAEIAGTRLLLLHGDAQCTDDTAYMTFRSQVRDPDWQNTFLARPLAERKALIAGMREGSRQAQRDKPMSIMDVNTGEIARLFDAHAVTLMIHGHTHRPAVHETNGRLRYVLPDWDCEAGAVRGGWIAIDAVGGIHRISLAN